MSETADNAAVETPETTAASTDSSPEVEGVEIHGSIADMLSNDSGAAALGGNDGVVDDVEVVADDDKAAAADLKEKGADVEAESPPAGKVYSQAEVDEMVGGFKATALAERSKRQTIEGNLKPEAKADLFEEPDKRLAQEIDPVEQRINNRFIAMSESQAKGRHDDFEVNYQAFAVATQADPSLISRAINAVDPGEFVYQEGKKQLLNNELGNGGLESLTEKIRAEEAAKLEDTINQRVDAKLKEVADLPPSAGDFKGKINAGKPVDTNLSLTDILGR